MQLFRKEVRTGLLVIITLAVLVAVLIVLGAPGVFTPMNHYYIFFDNAGGVKQGAPVLLAGRKVGSVTTLISPVPLSDRPARFKQDEILVGVEVLKSAAVYREVSVRMQQNSLLGDVVIDYTSGLESSGRAPNGAYFVGERAKDFTSSIADAVLVLKTEITPVAVEATKTMSTLRETAENLQHLTAPGSDFIGAVGRFHALADNLVELSKPGSTLSNSLENLNGSLKNVDKITTDLLQSNKINLTLDNIQEAARHMEKATSNLDAIILRLGPNLAAVTANAAEFTDTLKREPWRLIWHSTKEYPGDQPLGSSTPETKRKRRTPQ